MDLNVSRPVASPLIESKLTLSGELTETPDGFVVAIYAKGAAIATAPVTVTAAALVKDSDAIAGSFPDLRAGDAISGTGIAADTKVATVETEQITLSKAVTAAGENVALTVTPPKAASVLLGEIPLRVNVAMDPTLGSVLEISSALKLSGGEQALGQGQIVVDTELASQRVPRK